MGLIGGRAGASAPSAGTAGWFGGAGDSANARALSKKRGSARKSGSAAKGEDGEIGCATCRKAGGVACEKGAGGEDAPPNKGPGDEEGIAVGGPSIGPSGGCAGA